MNLDVEVELRDAPGQLVGVLELIGRFGGNVITVVHDRSRIRSGRVPVRFVFEAPDEGTGPMLEEIRRTYRVLRVQGAKDTHLSAFVLIGHVIQDDLSKVTEAVFGAGAEVRRIRVDIAKRADPSAVLIDVAATSDRIVREALNRVRQLSAERGYVFLDAVAEV
ncbi:MAG: hypothetical protein ACYDDF_08700 [Thermoplasmatota archaeon]